MWRSRIWYADGHLDAAVSVPDHAGGYQRHRLRVYWNDATAGWDGTARPTRCRRKRRRGLVRRPVSATDLDGDGDMDVAGVASGPYNSARACDGAAQCGRPRFCRKRGAGVANRPQTMLSSDFDGDGAADLAAGHADGR
jgi:hypothetical protein